MIFFMNPATAFHSIASCVALLYSRSINQLNS